MQPIAALAREARNAQDANETKNKKNMKFKRKKNPQIASQVVIMTADLSAIMIKI